MGLLDSVLGGLAGGQPARSRNSAAMGGLGGMAGLLGLLASNPQLLQAVVGMLGNDSAQGGLGGLVQKFQQAGLGNVMGSWIGKGQNQPISGNQVSSVLGQDDLSGLAEKLGLSPDAAAGQLSAILPGLIDHLTPDGQVPEGGVGNSNDLAGMLRGLLR